jgi:hypothetical protein
MITTVAPGFLVRLARNTAPRPSELPSGLMLSLELITPSEMDVITRSTIAMVRGFAAP